MLTTSRPKLWITLTIALLSFCCLGGLVLMFFAGAVTKEMGWFIEAGKAVQRSTQPRAEEMAYVRRLQAGENLTPELLTGLQKAARAMEARTAQEWARLDKIEAPERLNKMKDIARRGFGELQTGWADVASSLEKKDADGVRKALARLQSLGDRVKQDVQYEMENLYGKEAPRITPAGADPARPVPGVAGGSP